MEQISTWLTVGIGIVIPFIGWIFNTLITRKIDGVIADLDALQKTMEKDYVRKDLYEQAMKFHAEHTDDKFKSLLAIMTTQFANVEGKIEEIKKLINDKISNHKSGG